MPTPALCPCKQVKDVDSSTITYSNIIPAGNTIFLALGASGLPRDKPFGWLKSLVSISSFLFGCFIFSTTRYIGPKARGTLSVSFFIQAICIVIAAALVQGKVVPGQNLISVNGTFTEDIDLLELLPLGFLAFQSGGQIVTSRILGYNEVPTTVLTSVYCDIASDPNFLVKDNVKRNRRICAVLLILGGGIAGGFISKTANGLATALWVAASIKLGISIGWSLWKPKQAIQL